MRAENDTALRFTGDHCRRILDRDTTAAAALHQ